VTEDLVDELFRSMEVSLQEISMSTQLYAGRRLDWSHRFLLTGMILKISINQESEAFRTKLLCLEWRVMLWPPTT
jgi:hypothetical protein